MHDTNLRTRVWFLSDDGPQVDCLPSPTGQDLLFIAFPFQDSNPEDTQQSPNWCSAAFTKVLSLLCLHCSAEILFLPGAPGKWQAGKLIGKGLHWPPPVFWKHL